MKLALIFLCCFSATIYSCPLDSCDFGNPCESADNGCVGDKFKILVPLLLKKLGLPLTIPLLEILPGPGVLQVYVKAENSILEGLETVQINDVKLDLSGGKLVLDLTVESLKITTDYTINGRCLVVPVWGCGKGVVTLTDLRIVLSLAISIDNGQIVPTGINLDLAAGDICLDLNSLFGETDNTILTVEYGKVFNDNIFLIANDILPSLKCSLESALLPLLLDVFVGIDLNLLLVLLPV
ncbi:hypothetical protein HHI36_021266 [Cryptolaemus montrouzieri]|uniref:Uncharacterized protein n=1 Tax=Cryptolaemus montrouzieri TaxID=559131 RepID=A0ABD2MWD9_9CUCU